MPKIKILLMEEYAQDEYSDQIIRQGLTDWETVTEEELKFLQRNWNSYASVNLNGWQYKAVLCIDAPITPAIAIESIKKELAKAQKWHNDYIKKQEADKIKREEAKKRREEKKLLASTKTEEELYEKLKEKFDKKETNEV